MTLTMTFFLDGTGKILFPFLKANVFLKMNFIIKRVLNMLKYFDQVILIS